MLRLQPDWSASQAGKFLPLVHWPTDSSPLTRSPLWPPLYRDGLSLAWWERIAGTILDPVSRRDSDWATHCDLIVVLLALDLEDCDCVEIVANNLLLFAGDLVIQSDRELAIF